MLVLLDQVVDLLRPQAAREQKDGRFKALPELDRAARRLRAAILVLLDPPPGGFDSTVGGESALTSGAARTLRPR